MWRQRLLRAALTSGPLLLALAVEVAVFEWIGVRQGAPGFASTSTLIGVLNQSAVYGVMAVGMTFIIITGGIDLSVGSLLALCGVASASIVLWGGEPALLWVVLGGLFALGVGAASGVFAGSLVAFVGIPPFIATLALMSSLRGLGNLWTDGTALSPMPPAFEVIGRGTVPVPGLGREVPLSVLVFLGVVVFGWVLLNQTRFGRHVRAIGGNEESARLSGVPVARVKVAVYALGGVLTALAGLLLASRLGAGSPKVGVTDELAVIAAVVVGGTSLSGGRGGIGGTLLGLLVVTTLDSGLNWIGVGTFGQQVTLGVVILAAVLLDTAKARLQRAAAA